MTEPDPALIDLLVEWEDSRAAGTPIPPEKLCLGRPDLLDEFIALARQVERLEPLLALHAGPSISPLPFIPGFEILGVLGQGGMGVVYRARDVRLDQVVAIKKPHGRTAVSRVRFEREVKALGRLRDHPNIVPIYSAGLVGGEPYLVMEYIPGGSLAERKGQFAADPDRAAAFLARVARAVDHAHRAGILHRDLKPSNILIAADGQPRVSDFGVAALLAGEPVAAGEAAGLAPPGGAWPGGVTRTVGVAGTLAYCAPEAFRGPPGRPSPATDVWSLGVILYELLAGRHPFAGVTDDELQAAIVSRDPAAPCRVNPGVPRGLAAVVLRCLAKDPAARYPTAAALADALVAWRQRRRVAQLISRVGSAVLCVAVLIGAAAALLRTPDPEEVHARRGREVAARLGRGEAVPLVEAAGLPPSFRIRLGGGYTRTLEEVDGVFAVAAGRPALVELLADPGIDRYRLSAEVRQDGALGDASVGLYVGHQPVRGPHVDAEVFAHLRFSDLGRQAGQAPGPNGERRSVAALDHLCLVPPVAVGRDWIYHNGPQAFYRPPDPKAQPAPWRELRVAVTPQEIRAWFDREELGDYPLPLAAAWAGALPAVRREFAEAVVPITGRGGLGLYVSGGQASIRNCRIEPLP